MLTFILAGIILLIISRWPAAAFLFMLPLIAFLGFALVIANENNLLWEAIFFIVGIWVLLSLGKWILNKL